MCYTLYLSTDSAQDLSLLSNDRVRFERPGWNSPAAAQLSYPKVWYVGSKSGCSCTFRHLMMPDLGFGRPVEWYPEDEDCLTATSAFAAVVRRLLADGYSVDCVDAWCDSDEGLLEMDVDLGKVADDEFRFIEDRHFRFTRPAC